MNLLTNTLYYISAGLLIPVVVLLVLAFFWSLLMVGSFYSSYMTRGTFNKEVTSLILTIRKKKCKKFKIHDFISSNSIFCYYLENAYALDWEPIHCEKLLADFESVSEKALSPSKILMRIGPMLGLMGTLIPMGPALVGLAAGDIASMALNMQVAFSTTVVGVFCGAIGYVTQIFKRRWHIDDINHLTYIFDLVNFNNENEK